MIAIQLEGDSEFLETPPKVSISVRLENPILSDDDKLSPGSYSYPFDLPGGDISEKNSAKLKNPDVMENNEAYTIQKATLFCSSAPDSNIVPFKKGNLKAKSSDKGKISSYFTFGLNNLGPDFKTAKLRDVISENFVIGDSDINKYIYLKRTVAGDYNVTINGKNYVADGVNNLAIAINNDLYNSADGGKYFPIATEVTSGSTPSGLITATYLRVGLALAYTYYDEILELTFTLYLPSVDPLQELHVTTDSPEDYIVEANLGSYYSEFQTFLAGYINGTYPNDKVRFPLCFNGDAYGEPIKDGELVNGVDSSGLIVNDPNWGLNNDKPFQVKNYNSILPVLRRKWILDKIAETFDFLWDGDFYEHDDVENMLEWNTAALDVPQLFIGDKKFVFWKRSFNLSELVPDITVVEYLKRLRSRYNLAIYYNEVTQRIRISQREQMVKNLVFDDITTISSPLTRNEDQRITGFTLRYKKDETDSVTFDESISVGISEKDIPIECGRLFQTGADVIEDKSVTGPRVVQKWGSKGQMRTFYYTGIVDVTTFEYPGGSINGTIIYEPINNFVLSVGIYERFWKYWLHHQKNTRGAELKVSFPFRKLIKFDWELKRRFNRVNYLVKAIDLTITNQAVKVTNVELYSLQ